MESLANIQIHLRKFFVRFIQNPLKDLFSRLVSYWAEFADIQEYFEEKSTSKEPEEEEVKPSKPKTQSPNRFTVMINSLGTTVGLGQLWRFPNLAYQFGGGTFLVIYLLVTISMGYTLCFFDIANGQYSSKNALRVFEKVPLMQGVGVSIVFYSYVLIVYYTQIIGLGILYFAASFNFELPWLYCPSSSVGDHPDSVSCYEFNRTEPGGMEQIKCGRKWIRYNRELLCSDEEYAMRVGEECCSATGNPYPGCPASRIAKLCDDREHASSYYWSHSVVQVIRKDDFAQRTLGDANLKMVLASFAAWFFAYLFVTLGVKWSGVLVLVTLPLICISLLVMVSACVNVEGALVGLEHLFKPTLHSVKNPKIWLAAIEQSIFSLGISMGVLLTLGSKADFRNPSHTDSIFICLSVIAVTVLASAVVFSMIGYLSAKTLIPFWEVMEPGPGLAFIAYSEALGTLPAAWLPSIIFFFLFVSTGITTVSSIIDTISTVFCDLFSVSRKDRYIVNFLLIFSAFLLGIPMLLRGGLVIFESVDKLVGGLALVQINIFEVLTIVLFYGVGLFCEDIAFMVGFYPGRFFRYIWISSPLIMIAATVYGTVFITMSEDDLWANLLGWSVFTLVIAPTPFFMIYRLIAYIGGGKIVEVIRPPSGYGPPTEELRVLRSEFRTSRKVL